jgi:nitrogen fixation protein FixH
MSTHGRSSQRWFANGIEGRHVLMGLVAFFGVMLVANGLLVYYALGTFSGGDRPDPYRSGLTYNETIAAGERQAALGWQSEIAYDPAAARLTLRFADKAAEPVSGLRLDGQLTRPATDREDQGLAFTEVSPGVYAAEVALGPGRWVLSVESLLDEGGEPLHRLKRRLFVADRP